MINIIMEIYFQSELEPFVSGKHGSHSEKEEMESFILKREKTRAKATRKKAIKGHWGSTTTIGSKGS